MTFRLPLSPEIAALTDSGMRRWGTQPSQETADSTLFSGELPARFRAGAHPAA